MKVKISNGTISFIDKAEFSGLKEMGSVSRRRVSHVEPINRILRWIFHAIRKRVSDESVAAEWTRHWPCTWQARLFSGPTLRPFNNRQEAIDAEIQWIERQGVAR